MEKSSISNKLTSLHYFHYCIIACSLFLTIFAAYYSNKMQNEKQKTKFDREADRTVGLLVERMKQYEDALAAAAAFYKNSDEPNYSEWKKYVRDLRFVEKYPGINGIGLVKVVEIDELMEFEKKAQLERPNYKVSPKHSREIALPILYVEPEEVNLEAIGLDLAWEENRYQAAMKAASEGTPQITGPIILVQDSLKTPGFLFFLPIYNEQEELIGYVDSPFIIKNLMEGVLSKENRHVLIKIESQDQELYNEHLDSAPSYDPNPLFSKSIQVPIYGQIWSFSIFSDREFHVTEGSLQPVFILFIGIVIDILLTYLLMTMSSISKTLRTNTEMITQKLNRKTAELIANEERLKLAFEGTSDGIWDWDIIQDTINYSKRFEELLGFSENEIKDSFDEFYSRIHPDDQEFVLSAIDAHIQRRETYDLEYRLRLKNGSYHWFRVRGKALWNSEGRAVRMVGSLSDISLEKQAATHLENANKKLEKTNRELEQFTYIASHDLRSPLVNIMGFSEELEFSCSSMQSIIQSEGDLSPEQRTSLIRTLANDIPESLRFIGESVERMDMYSGSILELSRIGRRELNPKNIETNSLVESLISGNMHQIKRKNISVEIHTLPDVYADEISLIQIFGNLIDNSIKYSKEASQNSISISGELVDGTAIFRISDTGIGIPQSGVEKVFDVFQRGAHSEIPGSGMGLTFVKTLVEKQEGMITCESIEGEGTTFTFSIAEAAVMYEKQVI